MKRSFSRHDIDTPAQSSSSTTPTVTTSPTATVSPPLVTTTSSSSSSSSEVDRERRYSHYVKVVTEYAKGDGFDNTYRMFNQLLLDYTSGKSLHRLTKPRPDVPEVFYIDNTKGDLHIRFATVRDMVGTILGGNKPTKYDALIKRIADTDGRVEFNLEEMIIVIMLNLFGFHDRTMKAYLENDYRRANRYLAKFVAISTQSKRVVEHGLKLRNIGFANRYPVSGDPEFILPEDFANLFFEIIGSKPQITERRQALISEVDDKFVGHYRELIARQSAPLPRPQPRYHPQPQPKLPTLQSQAPPSDMTESRYADIANEVHAQAASHVRDVYRFYYHMFLESEKLFDPKRTAGTRDLKISRRDPYAARQLEGIGRFLSTCPGFDFVAHSNLVQRISDSLPLSSSSSSSSSSTTTTTTTSPLSDEVDVSRDELKYITMAQVIDGHTISIGAFLMNNYESSRIEHQKMRRILHNVYIRVKHVMKISQLDPIRRHIVLQNAPMASPSTYIIPADFAYVFDELAGDGSSIKLPPPKSSRQFECLKANINANIVGRYKVLSKGRFGKPTVFGIPEPMTDGSPQFSVVVGNSDEYQKFTKLVRDYARRSATHNTHRMFRQLLLLARAVSEPGTFTAPPFKKSPTMLPRVFTVPIGHGAWAPRLAETLDIVSVSEGFNRARFGDLINRASTAGEIVSLNELILIVVVKLIWYHFDSMRFFMDNNYTSALHGAETFVEALSAVYKFVRHDMRFSALRRIPTIKLPGKQIKLGDKLVTFPSKEIKLADQFILPEEFVYVFDELFETPPIRGTPSEMLGDKSGKFKEKVDAVMVAPIMELIDVEPMDEETPPSSPRASLTPPSTPPTPELVTPPASSSTTTTTTTSITKEQFTSGTIGSYHVVDF